jgi:hypothetical protein
MRREEREGKKKKTGKKTIKSKEGTGKSVRVKRMGMMERNEKTSNKKARKEEKSK